MSKFLHNDNDVDNDDDDTEAIAIPRVFSENSRAKNVGCYFKSGGYY